MDVKGGTKTFSSAQQNPNYKSDGVQTLGVAQREAALGGENVGEVLNKISDPNWVDPAKMRKVGNNQLDKDAFMKLMLTQMKHQDPTNPMQSHEMAAQLAQFTSLEQLTNINTTLEGMKSAQAPSTNYQALNFIGKKVSGDTSRLMRTATDKEHEFNYQLMSDAPTVKVHVVDAEGTTIRTITMQNQKKGTNSVRWNGLTEDGTSARPGEYRFSLEAVASNGRKVHAKTEFDGKITGMNFTAQGPVLMIGDQAIRLQDVKKIQEAGPEDRMEEVQSTRLAPRDEASTKSNQGASPVKEDTPNLMSKNVAMSRNMLNEVKKATGN